MGGLFPPRSYFKVRPSLVLSKRTGAEIGFLLGCPPPRGRMNRQCGARLPGPPCARVLCLGPASLTLHVLICKVGALMPLVSTVLVQRQGCVHFLCPHCVLDREELKQSLRLGYEFTRL